MRDVDRILMDQNRNKRQAVLNTVMNLRVQKYTGNFLTGWGTLIISRKTLLHGIRLHTIEVYGTFLMVQEGRSSDGCFVVKDITPETPRRTTQNISGLSCLASGISNKVFAILQHLNRDIQQKIQLIQVTALDKFSFIPFSYIFVLNIPTFLVCCKSINSANDLGQFEVQYKSRTWEP